MTTAIQISGETRAATRPSFRAWMLAIRPKTLLVSVVPVMVGTALAHARGTARPASALAALLGALLIQVGTNLINDYYDFKKGADSTLRVGPVRVTQSGLISPSQVMAGGMGCFGAALLVGVYLALVGGWPIVVVGLLSLGAGYAYTGGPFPLGYHGLGDLFVFIFFGLVAVAGTYYVQAGAIDRVVLLAAIPVGAIATAVLVVNNLRDMATDAKAGKRTLAVRLGARATQAEYFVLLTVALATPALLWWTKAASPWVLLSYCALPLALPPAQRVLGSRGGAHNAALAQTARFHLVFGALFSLGLMLSRGGVR